MSVTDGTPGDYFEDEGRQSNEITQLNQRIAALTRALELAPCTCRDEPVYSMPPKGETLKLVCARCKALGKN